MKTLVQTLAESSYTVQLSCDKDLAHVISDLRDDGVDDGISMKVESVWAERTQEELREMKILKD